MPSPESFGNWYVAKLEHSLQANFPTVKLDFIQSPSTMAQYIDVRCIACGKIDRVGVGDPYSPKYDVSSESVMKHVYNYVLKHSTCQFKDQPGTVAGISRDSDFMVPPDKNPFRSNPKQTPQPLPRRAIRLRKASE